MDPLDRETFMTAAAVNVLPRFGVEAPDAFASRADYEAALRFAADGVEVVLAKWPSIAANPITLAIYAHHEILCRIFRGDRPSWVREIVRPHADRPGGDYLTVFGDCPTLPEGWILRD